ncbi:MAG: hypothetical protein GX569_05055 [Candidatus Riflebacteria bacterium]|nr:hypothetical protein [Candidatus Riflebacteria bacterium]
MVTQPIELSMLEMKRTILLLEIDKLVADKALLAEIKKLAGVDFSLKSLFGKAFGIGGLLDPRAVDEVRQRVALTAPGALDKFDELIEVCQEYNRKNKPLVVY